MPYMKSHGSLHNELMKYSHLTQWMRECENRSFVEVCKVSQSGEDGSIQYGNVIERCVHVHECYCRLQVFSIVSVDNECIDVFFFPFPFRL